MRPFGKLRLPLIPGGKTTKATYVAKHAGIYAIGSPASGFRPRSGD